MERALKFLATLLALLLVLSPAYALMLSAPTTIEIGETGTVFFIEITNTSKEDKFLELKFFSPVEFTFLTIPAVVKADSQAKVKVLLAYNKDLAGLKYNAVIEAKLGQEKAVQEMEIRFKPKELSLKALDVKKQEEAKKAAEEAETMAGTGFMTLFSMPSFDFSLTPATELILDGILLVIAAVLLIAFIARLNHRVRDY